MEECCKPQKKIELMIELKTRTMTMFIDEEEYANFVSQVAHFKYVCMERFGFATDELISYEYYK